MQRQVRIQQHLARGVALVTKAARELARVAAYAVVLKRLAEIRNDLTAEAPDKWEDLLPPDWDTNAEFLEQGRALILAEQQAIRKMAEARRDKVKQGLQELGVIKSTPVQASAESSQLVDDLFEIARTAKQEDQN